MVSKTKKLYLSVMLLISMSALHAEQQNIKSNDTEQVDPDQSKVKALEQTQRIDFLLEHIALRINSKTLTVKNKEQTEKFIKDARSFALQVLHEAPLSVEDITIANAQLLNNLEKAVKASFNAIKFTVTAITGTVTTFQNEEKLNRLIPRIHALGVSSVNKITRAIEHTVLSKKLGKAALRTLPYASIYLYYDYMNHGKVTQWAKRAFKRQAISREKLVEDVALPEGIIPPSVEENLIKDEQFNLVQVLVKTPEENGTKRVDVYQPKQAKASTANQKPAAFDGKVKIGALNLDLQLGLNFGIGALLIKTIQKDAKDLFGWIKEQSKRPLAHLKGDAYESPEKLRPSKVKLNEIVGYDHVKAVVKHIAHYYAHKDLFDKTGTHLDRGYLFVGPLDIGKSLAQSVASEVTIALESRGIKLPCKIYELSATDLIRKKLEDIVKEIEESAPTVPSVILLENLSWVAKYKEKDQEFWGNLLGTLSKNLRGSKKQVIIIATANSLDELDPGIYETSRLSNVIRFELPSSAERKAYFEKELNKRHISLVGFNTDELAAQTEGHSYNTLASVVKEAFAQAQKASRRVLQKDFETAIEDIIFNISNRPQHLTDTQIHSLAHYWAGQAVAHLVLQPKQKLMKATIDLVDNHQGGLITYGERTTKFNTDADITKSAVILLAGQEAQKTFSGESAITFRKEVQSNVYKKALGIVFNGVEPKFFSKTNKEQRFAQAQQLVEIWTEQARQLITKHKLAIEYIAKELITQKTLSAQQMQQYIA